MTNAYLPQLLLVWAPFAPFVALVFLTLVIVWAANSWWVGLPVMLAVCALAICSGLGPGQIGILWREALSEEIHRLRDRQRAASSDPSRAPPRHQAGLGEFAAAVAPELLPLPLLRPHGQQCSLAGYGLHRCGHRRGRPPPRTGFYEHPAKPSVEAPQQKGVVFVPHTRLDPDGS